MLYTIKEKRRHIEELCRCLSDLIDELNQNDKYPSALRDYKIAKSLAESYLVHGYQQADLNELATNIPDICYRHREWIPPIEFGCEAVYPYIVAGWFEKIDQKYSKVQKAAERVRAIGEY